MKRQEILDAVTIHAKKMNKQSSDEHGYCVYRGTNGKMCLIGALIKDEFYDKEFDRGTKSAGEDEIILALKKSGVFGRGEVPESTKQFLVDLQYAHDDISNSLLHSSFRESLKNNLQRVAELYKLKLNW